MREVARAARHRAHGRVARVVRLQVAPRLARRAQRARAQRAAQRLPAPLARPARRVCQRTLRRGICNADSTRLLSHIRAGPLANPTPNSTLPNPRNKLSKNITLYLNTISIDDPVSNRSRGSIGTSIRGITTRRRAVGARRARGAGCARRLAVSKSSVAGGCRALAAGG